MHGWSYRPHSSLLAATGGLLMAAARPWLPLFTHRGQRCSVWVAHTSRRNALTLTFQVLFFTYAFYPPTPLCSAQSLTLFCLVLFSTTLCARHSVEPQGRRTPLIAGGASWAANPLSCQPASGVAFEQQPTHRNAARKWEVNRQTDGRLERERAADKLLNIVVVLKNSQPLNHRSRSMRRLRAMQSHSITTSQLDELQEPWNSVSQSR